MQGGGCAYGGRAGGRVHLRGLVRIQLFVPLNFNYRPLSTKTFVKRELFPEFVNSHQLALEWLRARSRCN